MDKKARLETELVHQFVKVSHGGFEQVKAMLAQEPALVNACWDWGGGDWETALGAAAHTGSKEIAEYLLAHGARMDLFCAVLLGKMGVVKAFLEDDPAVIHVKGPHGIPLLAHAEISEQAEIVALLKSYGAE